MTTLNTLPDLCLLAIFDRLPVRDLLSTINLVNRRWNSLLSSACARRHHPLILTKCKEHFKQSIGISTQEYDPMNLVTNEKTGEPLLNLDKIMHDYELHSIECEKISSKFCLRLISLFPKLLSLEFIQFESSFSQIEQLNHLLGLNGWRSTLVQLKLWVLPSTIKQLKAEHHYKSLFDSINSLTHLKYLDLYIQVPYFSYTKFPVSLPIVSQLEVLKFDGYGFSEEGGRRLPWKSLEMQDRQPNLQLKEIHLGYRALIQGMNKYDVISPEFAKRFMNLSFIKDITESNLDAFQRFFQKFSSLKRVRFEITNLSMYHFTAALSELTQLEHLKIITSDNLLQRDGENENEVENPQICSSVKAISLKIPFKSHAHLAAFQLHLYFPSIQVIHLELFGPTNCNLCNNSNTSPKDPNSNLPDLPKCIQESFQECKNLRKILIRIRTKQLTTFETYEMDINSGIFKLLL